MSRCCPETELVDGPTSTRDSQTGDTMNTLLQPLTTQTFVDSIGFTLPPVPMCRVLQRSAEVRRLKMALRIGQITDREIREFVGQLLRQYLSGQAFRHDFALAALAVALEHWDHRLAKEYLLDLARLERGEFAVSFRVARECLNRRVGNG